MLRENIPRKTSHKYLGPRNRKRKNKMKYKNKNYKSEETKAEECFSTDCVVLVPKDHPSLYNPGKTSDPSDNYDELSI